MKGFGMYSIDNVGWIEKRLPKRVLSIQSAVLSRQLCAALTPMFPVAATDPLKTASPGTKLKRQM